MVQIFHVRLPLISSRVSLESVKTEHHKIRQLMGCYLDELVLERVIRPLTTLWTLNHGSPLHTLPKSIFSLRN